MCVCTGTVFNPDKSWHGLPQELDLVNFSVIHFIICNKKHFIYIKPHLSDQEIKNYQGVINGYVKECEKKRDKIRDTVGKSHKKFERKGDTVVLEEYLVCNSHLYNHLILKIMNHYHNAS